MAELNKKLIDAIKNANENFVGNVGMDKMRVRLTFVEEVLGSASPNKDIHSEYIASKAPDAKSREEEIAAIGADEVEAKEMTVFARDTDGCPMIFDYHILGYFKDVCGKLKRVDGSKCKGLTAHKKNIEAGVSVLDRRIRFNVDGSIGSCQRPLRGETAQGSIVALANSETINPGSTIEFTILYTKKMLPYIVEMLNAGIRYGFGQWRNSGKGRFLWTELDETGKAIGGNYAE